MTNDGQDGGPGIPVHVHLQLVLPEESAFGAMRRLSGRPIRLHGPAARLLFALLDALMESEQGDSGRDEA